MTHQCRVLLTKNVLTFYFLNWFTVIDALKILLLQTCVCYLSFYIHNVPNTHIPHISKNTSRLNLIQDIFCINANKIHIIPNIYFLEYNSAIFTEVMFNKTLHLQNMEKRFYIFFLQNKKIKINIIFNIYPLIKKWINTKNTGHLSFNELWCQIHAYPQNVKDYYFFFPYMNMTKSIN